MEMEKGLLQVSQGVPGNRFRAPSDLNSLEMPITLTVAPKSAA
jgi:hypothetical protein